MALDINAAALGAFRNVDFGNANAIANLDGDTGIRQNGQLGSIFGRLLRSSAEKEANNAIRTELLKSLGAAFGLDGVGEKDGKVTFSRDFMDKLERALGPALKRSDFGIGADGTVTSGKPLTERRINAIAAKVEQMAEEGAGVGDVETGETSAVENETGFSVAGYKRKLASIKKDLGLSGLSSAKLDALNADGSTPPIKKLFIHVGKALDFLAGITLGEPAYNEKGEKISYNYPGSVDKSFIRTTPNLQYALDLEEVPLDTSDVKYKEDVRFQFRMPGSTDEDYQTLTDTTNLENGFNVQLFKALGGELIHTERAHFDKTGTDIEPLKKYIAQTLQLFAQKMIDVYEQCKAGGKMEEFEKHCERPGACMEEKCLQLTNFQDKHFGGVSDLSAAEKAELERIANTETGARCDKLIFDAMSAATVDNNALAASEDWADFADVVKEKLVGQVAQILTPIPGATEDAAYTFEPMLDNRGNPVVRALTADDIDRMGPACLHNVTAI